MKYPTLAPLLFVLWAFVVTTSAFAGIDDGDDLEDLSDVELEITPLAGPFEFPSSISLLPDGSALVTERVGQLWLVTPDLRRQRIDGVPPVLSRDHAGLLDIALDSGYATNGYLYLSYSHGSDASSTIRVTRARLDLLRHELVQHEVIFESTPAAGFEHLGGRMVITDDGYLFLSIGDRQDRARAQDLADHAGSIIRIRTDGSVPTENPFAAFPGARPEIWSYGHRNPQGLALDLRTGRLWAHEHGVQGGDELNLILSGANYGWPIVTYSSEYTGEPIGTGFEGEGVEAPLHYWKRDIAPAGLSIESTDVGPIFWLGALVGQALVQLEMRGDRIVGERRFLQKSLGRIRDVRLGFGGVVYLVTDAPDGVLYRVKVARMPPEMP